MAQIIIDEVAAKLDINRIERALPELKNAKVALERVKAEGENSKGETGTAIVEKATALIKRINTLMNMLSETKTEIQVTLNQNFNLDNTLASKINSSGF